MCINERQYQYFDTLKYEYDDKYGHQLYAIDNIEETKRYLDLNNLQWKGEVKPDYNDFNIYIVELRGSQEYPITLRKCFDTSKAAKDAMTELMNEISRVYNLENSIYVPTSRYL